MSYLKTPSKTSCNMSTEKFLVTEKWVKLLKTQSVFIPVKEESKF